MSNLIIPRSLDEKTPDRTKVSVDVGVRSFNPSEYADSNFLQTEVLPKLVGRAGFEDPCWDDFPVSNDTVFDDDDAKKVEAFANQLIGHAKQAECSEGVVYGCVFPFLKEFLGTKYIVSDVRGLSAKESRYEGDGYHPDIDAFKKTSLLYDDEDLEKDRKCGYGDPFLLVECKGKGKSSSGAEAQLIICMLDFHYKHETTHRTILGFSCCVGAFTFVYFDPATKKIWKKWLYTSHEEKFRTEIQKGFKFYKSVLGGVTNFSAKLSTSTSEPTSTTSTSEPTSTTSTSEPTSTTSTSEPTSTTSTSEPVSTTSVSEPVSTTSVSEPVSTTSEPSKLETMENYYIDLIRTASRISGNMNSAIKQKIYSSIRANMKVDEQFTEDEWNSFLQENQKQFIDLIEELKSYTIGRTSNKGGSSKKPGTATSQTSTTPKKVENASKSTGISKGSKFESKDEENPENPCPSCDVHCDGKNKDKDCPHRSCSDHCRNSSGGLAADYGNSVTDFIKKNKKDKKVENELTSVVVGSLFRRLLNCLGTTRVEQVRLLAASTQNPLSQQIVWSIHSFNEETSVFVTFTQLMERLRPYAEKEHWNDDTFTQEMRSAITDCIESEMIFEGLTDRYSFKI